MVLTVEGGLYFSPIMSANQNFIRVVINGTKLFVYLKNVKWTKVLHIEKLDLKSILKFWRDNANIDQSISTQNFRTEIGSVINIVVYDEFQLFIKNAMKIEKTVGY